MTTRLLPPAFIAVAAASAPPSLGIAPGETAVSIPQRIVRGLPRDVIVALVGFALGTVAVVTSAGEAAQPRPPETTILVAAKGEPGPHS